MDSGCLAGWLAGWLVSDPSLVLPLPPTSRRDTKSRRAPLAVSADDPNGVARRWDAQRPTCWPDP